jgi:tetratricopeptide (TPR) repeat protein
MPTVGRNEACPCGSGKKYKRCCLQRDEAAMLATSAAQPSEPATLAAIKGALHTRFEDYQATREEVAELDQASNAVIDLIDAGRLDDAEHAARELLVQYPEIHDGHDRLGMVYEARGLPREAAECYRQVLAFIRAHPDHYEPAIETTFIELIAKLDPPPAG